MQDPYARLTELLDALAAELQRRALWSDQAPPRQALASTAPFCHDTLAFDQWLQWIFIPRVRELIALRGALPASCNIAPMAEVAYGQVSWDTAELIDLLRAIDQHFSVFDAALH
jgi:uncharacterized protein YqcC (DUF446 family)